MVPARHAALAGGALDARRRADRDRAHSRRLRATATCTHIRSIERSELPERIEGCEECLAQGMAWVHLRMCQTCGHIGCCDNSPGRHATTHFEDSGHPIIRSVEPGEDWSWCYVDEVTFRLPPPVTG